MTGERRPMTAYEFSEWWVYNNKFNPFGEFRDDLRSGVAASAILNELRRQHWKDPTLTKPGDFILDMTPAKPEEPMSMEAMQRTLKAFHDQWYKNEKPKQGRAIGKKR
jgi:hypothetical protein